MPYTGPRAALKQEGSIHLGIRKTIKPLFRVHKVTLHPASINVSKNELVKKRKKSFKIFPPVFFPYFVSSVHAVMKGWDYTLYEPSISCRCLWMISSLRFLCLSYLRMRRSLLLTSCSFNNVLLCISTFSISNSCTLHNSERISLSSWVLILFGSSCRDKNVKNRNKKGPS